MTPIWLMALLFVATFATFSYAVAALIDEYIDARQQRQSDAEWARLTRFVIAARRDLGEGA